VHAVTDEIVDELALVGPAGHVADQLTAWREGPITTLIVEPTHDDAIEQIAEIWSTL
jgi:hypothetical protein